MDLPPLPSPGAPTAAGRRVAQLFGGFLTLGLGIALVLHADLGAAPWDVLHQGIARRTPLTVGTATMLVGLLVFVAWVPLRERPGVGTVLNVLLVGPTVDVALTLVPEATGLGTRVAYLALGTLSFGTGVGLYIAAGLGPGPRDGVMTGLARRGVPVRWVRTGLESAALGLGWLLGGTVGVGTIVVAAGVGHVIHPVLRLAGTSERATTPRAASRATTTATAVGTASRDGRAVQGTPTRGGDAAQAPAASSTRCSSNRETSLSR